MSSTGDQNERSFYQKNPPQIILVPIAPISLVLAGAASAHETYVSRAKVALAKRSEKGYGDENGYEAKFTGTDEWPDPRFISVRSLRLSGLASLANKNISVQSLGKAEVPFEPRFNEDISRRK